MSSGTESTAVEWCEALYEQQADALLLYGRALGLSHVEAEDVLHEVFQALLQLPTPPEAPDRYAVRAYRHRAINRHRSIWRRWIYELKAQPWFEDSSSITDNENKAMACLTRLPAEQREVIVLKFWHNQTFEEIGALLGISPNTAAGRYRYGVSKLRIALQSVDTEFPLYERPLDSTTTQILAPATSFRRT